MFTGIVEEQGTVRAVQRLGDVVRLDIEARATLEGSELGASVAVNGACLTVVALRPHGFSFAVGPETLGRTTLGRRRAGTRVNRTAAAVRGRWGARPGHVDGVATVVVDPCRIDGAGADLAGPERPRCWSPRGRWRWTA
jgi:riboflavin synthase